MIKESIKHVLADYSILEITGRIFVAYIMGIFIGWERAQHKKPIGSRTTSIVCMGAAILSCYEDVFAHAIMLENEELIRLGSELLYTTPDYNRISAQIVSGIGFLGAGMIIQNRGKLHGITTAAIVWVTACLGIVIGSGQWVLSTIGCICIFLSTSIYRFFIPYFIANKKKSIIYLIECSSKIDIETELDRFGIKLINLEILGWKEVINNDKKMDKNIVLSPNLISKVHIFVPSLDYANIENILKSLGIRPIKMLERMRDKVDLHSIK
ncbi:MgtC/SapB family protein [Brachyspira innocens]|uniref:MgtC/SapB family protein n=1 Tax=Brachyspira innocens TaxID=13264 RepID=UPI00035CB9A9|nr:MgtC/SapB family protein [Brachyspira innocens]